MASDVSTAGSPAGCSPPGRSKRYGSAAAAPGTLAPWGLPAALDNMGIERYGTAELPALRAAGRVAAQTLQHVGQQLRIGMSTRDIDQLVRQDTARRGGKTSQLGYHGFPAAVCTSRNQVVCHGIPSPHEHLRDGDLINVDVTTYIGGFHGDTSATF